MFHVPRRILLQLRPHHNFRFYSSMPSKVTHRPFSADKDPSQGNEAVTLYASSVCPFVQKTRIALLEKGIDYESVEIDLKQPRPQWYLDDINYRGKVPAMRHKGNVMFESAPLVEYIEEAFDGPNLLPKDLHLRQVARTWIQFSGDSFVPAFYQFLSELDEFKHPERKEKMDKVFEELENALKQYQTGSGPFFFGDEFTAVDINFLPFFERFVTLEHYRGYQLPEKFTRVKRWREEGLERQSVKDTGYGDKEGLIAAYSKFAKK